MPAIVIARRPVGRRGQGQGDRPARLPTIDYSSSSTAATTPATPIVVNDEKFATHLLPSGILTPGLHPGHRQRRRRRPRRRCSSEIDGLEARGIDTSPAGGLAPTRT